MPCNSACGKHLHASRTTRCISRLQARALHSFSDTPLFIFPLCYAPHPPCTTPLSTALDASHSTHAPHILFNIRISTLRLPTTQRQALPGSGRKSLYCVSALLTYTMTQCHAGHLTNFYLTFVTIPATQNLLQNCNVDTLHELATLYTSHLPPQSPPSTLPTLTVACDPHFTLHALPSCMLHSKFHLSHSTCWFGVAMWYAFGVCGLNQIFKQFHVPLSCRWEGTWVRMAGGSAWRLNEPCGCVRTSKRKTKSISAVLCSKLRIAFWTCENIPWGMRYRWTSFRPIIQYSCNLYNRTTNQPNIAIGCCKP